MPQMAPLMWNVLFLITSIVLMITLTKIYFFLSDKKEFNKEKESFNVNTKNKLWLW